MNTVPSSVKAPRFPQVNLLPPEVEMRRSRGRQRGVAVVFMVLFVLALGAGAFLVEGMKAAVESDLAAAKLRNTQLQEEAALYSEVPIVTALRNNIVDARAYAGASEINYLDFDIRFTAAVPEGVIVERLGWSRVGLTNNGPEATGPFARADIGVLTFSGRSDVPINLAELSDALERVMGIEYVRINLAVRTADEGGAEDSGDGSIYYEFEGVARLTIEALSGRFAPDDVPAAEPTDGADSGTTGGDV